jgi:acyl dehydratase
VTDDAGVGEDVLKGIIGKSTGTSKVVVERGPVTHFADAVLSTSPIYHDPAAATAAGFDAIPAPPTWPFVMEFSGKFPEMQVGDTPSPHPLATVLVPLMESGALLLHGEEEFIYHRPVMVGDVLIGKGSIVDAYRKESKGKTMTFVVSETNWSDEKTGDPVVTVRYNTICRA